MDENFNESGLFAGTSQVTMPPRWDSDIGTEYNYLLLKTDVDLNTFASLPNRIAAMSCPNPRVLSPFAMELSSLYHPLFYQAMLASADSRKSQNLSEHISSIKPLSLALNLSHKVVYTSPQYWLQSMLFLSSVTLGAAIIQDRWSPGTINSKLARLWYAGIVARRLKLASLAKLGLCDTVEDIANNPGQPSLSIFLRLKELFSAALDSLDFDVAAGKEVFTVKKLDSRLRHRFGFLGEIKEKLGANLIAVIVYGSSVNSSDYADYDLMLVVHNDAKALKALASSNPMFDDRELNIGVYDQRDFWNFQLVSGDNLPDQAICLYGEVEIPIKPRNDLIHRNFSFGYIRLRQLLGMASYAAQQNIADRDEDNKSALFQYFVKIPLNVIRGIQGALGESMSKEQVIRLCDDQFGFNVATQARLCLQGDAASALAAAAWTTEKALQHYNRKINVF